MAIRVNTNKFTKDPNATLDFKFDWRALTNGSGTSDWLEDGESISTYTVVAEDGITVADDELTDSNTSVTVHLSGGTANEDYTVTNHIVTSIGRVDDRMIDIRVRER